MEGFDTSTMTYTGVTTTGLQYGHAPDNSAYSKMLMDNYEQSSNYDAHTYPGSEDVYGLQQQQQQQQHQQHQHHQHHQSTPSIKPFTNNFDDPKHFTPNFDDSKHFTTNFEDPFSDVVSASAFADPINQDTYDGETTVDRDHKLLSFRVPTLDYVLLDYLHRQASASLTAQLSGMFFLAESPWANPGHGTSPPAELTCYRRNLFQITGTVTLPRSLHYVFHDGEQMAIVSQELVVTASESTEGNPVKLISVPWKSSATANPSVILNEDTKVEKEPPAIPLDMASIQDVESEYATFPFQWKRLQFRIATANNGRRKELQQHFVLHLRIMATCANGTRLAIATAQSGAIIVRGRSPRNFQSRKDTPLTGATNHVRKQSVIQAPGHVAQRLPQYTSHDPHHTKNEPTSAPIKTEGPAPPMSVTSFYDPNDYSMAPGPGLFDNTFLSDPRHHHQHQLQTHSHNMAITAIPPEQHANFDSSAAANNYPLSSPDLSRPTPGAAHAHIQQSFTTTPVAALEPMKLSLVDDDLPKHAPSVSPHVGSMNAPHNNAAAHPAKRIASMAPPPPSSTNTRLPTSFSLNVVSSPDESADLLYEYFPLSLDDWMPPVDAVYRPHVVHHIKPLGSGGPEAALLAGGGAAVTGRKTGAGGVWGGRSKRYFSEDVG